MEKTLTTLFKKKDYKYFDPIIAKFKRENPETKVMEWSKKDLMQLTSTIVDNGFDITYCGVRHKVKKHE